MIPQRKTGGGTPTLIRPTDKELSEGGGTLGCAGADIWAMTEAVVRGDAIRVRQLLDHDSRLARAEYWYTFPLHYAVREGHVAVAALLMEAGADPTAVRYGGEDLVLVAQDRNHHEVADLIKRAQQAQLQGQSVDHPLHQALLKADEAEVRDWLEKEPQLLATRDARGRTPLHLAVLSGSRQVLEVVLAAGPDLEARTSASDPYLPAHFTAVELAVWDSDFWMGVVAKWDLVDCLLRAGANYSLPIAAARNDRAAMEAKLAQHPDLLDAPAPGGRRALSCAAQFGHTELALWLLQKGANPNLEEGRYTPHGSALFFAADNRDYVLVEKLLAAGANPEGSVDSCGFVWHRADETIRLQLYRYGMRVTEFDLRNVDALALWADLDPDGLSRAGCGGVFTSVVQNEWQGATDPISDERKEALLRMLLAKGVRVPEVVTGCRTYLWHKPHLTRILLEHGMDPNLPNWQRVTPLHNLCERSGRGEGDPNRLHLAELFLEFGADIDARDEEYRSTPLGWACRNGMEDMVALLLRRGAALSLPDDEPWATPLAWARKRGHGGVVQLLEAAGAV